MFIKLITKLLIIFFSSFYIFAEEIQIESSNMNIINDGKTVLANNAKILIPSENLQIDSNKLVYDKENRIITFINNVNLDDKSNNIVLKSNLVKYKESTEIIYSEGKTKINIENKYNIVSENVNFDRTLKRIFADSETLIEDNQNNFYILKKGFVLDLISENLKAKKSIIIDNNSNKYIFENLFINLKKNEIAGKELKVEFEKSYFGNKNNDPTLKGRSSYLNEDELKVYKAVFSTCNIENKKCRGWEVNSDEFKHDKVNQIFEYKNSWLKLFDYKIFYTPYFNHPDPSVKRKSGFLTPSYSSSESLGFSLNVPYFKVLSNDKDITFNPKYYADKSFLLQNEYRQALKNSSIISDFSFLFGEAGTKGHLFYNQIGKLKDNLNFEINLQSVEGDNYLKNHKLADASSLIEDDSVLISNLDLNWDFGISKLSTSFKIFEDLSKNYSDRYQYVFPDFSFSRNIKLPESYRGKFTFNSYGYNKFYDTNVSEAVITNDFLFESNEFISKNGVATNYNVFLKNPTSYAENSTNFKDNEDYNLYGTIKLDTSLPMQKKVDLYTHYLKPVVSLRYSPNGNNDISSKDILLNYDNVFSLDRIGTSNQVEGGEALSLGLEFKRNLNGSDIFDFKIANVLKLKENLKLPTKSKLNKTRSDIFGSIKYNINDNLNLGYDFSYDRDLKYSNLEGLLTEFKLNNIYTDFYYYTTDNDLGRNETIKNNTIINLNNESSIKFSTTKDLIENFTEFYNYIYTYETDCISLNLNYNKSYYQDGNLKPDESLSFLIKIIPFTELGVNNLGSLIKK